MELNSLRTFLAIKRYQQTKKLKKLLTLNEARQKCLCTLQISNQLLFFTKIQDFLHAQCKKSRPEVKNLPPVD